MASRCLALFVLCPLWCPLAACSAGPTCDNLGGTLSLNGQPATTCSYSTAGGGVTVTALIADSPELLTLRLPPGTGTYTCNGGGASVLYVDASNLAYASETTLQVGPSGSCTVSVTAPDASATTYPLTAPVGGVPSGATTVVATGVHVGS